MTITQTPRRGLVPTRPVAIDLKTDDSVDATWRRLCAEVRASWLEEIRTLRVSDDDLETSLDIWTVALTAELKDTTRRETASTLLARLLRHAEAMDDRGPEPAD
ncbi:MAG: hypothetical protein ACYTGP_09150 [Planctomycetota bacterium]|jgi:hypothetical protein